MSSRRMLAQATLDRLGLEFEMRLYERVVAGAPAHLRALEGLADVYARAGRTREANGIDRRLCDLLPDSAAAHYNLACSSSLSGDLPSAATALERALDLGFGDVARIERDRDLAALRASPLFAPIGARVRRRSPRRSRGSRAEPA